MNGSHGAIPWRIEDRIGVLAPGRPERRGAPGTAMRGNPAGRLPRIRRRSRRAVDRFLARPPRALARGRMRREEKGA